MKALLLYNLQYDGWANAEFAKALQNPEVADAAPKVALWMSHILLAARIWAERAEGLAITQNAWEVIEPESYVETIRVNLQRWETLLGNEDDPCSRVVAYQNLRGQRFETPLYQIIAHLTHHGSYHRGQMASAMKAAGLEIPATDAILYARLL